MTQKRDPFAIGLLFSFCLHIGLLIFIVGNFFWHPPLDSPTFMTVDIVTLGPQTQAPQLPKPAVTKKATPTPQFQQETAETPPTLAKDQEKEEKKPLPDDSSIPRPEKPKLPKKKKERVEKKASPPKKQKKQKPQLKASKKAKDLNALLNDIEGDDTESSLDTLLSDPKSTSSQAASQVGPPTITELDLIRQQLRKYWNKPDALKGTKVQVVVELILTPQGKIQNFIVDSQASTLGHPIYQVILESVERALNNPAFHLPLSMERYETWKNLRLTFKDD